MPRKRKNREDSVTEVLREEVPKFITDVSEIIKARKRKAEELGSSSTAVNDTSNSTVAAERPKKRGRKPKAARSGATTHISGSSSAVSSSNLPSEREATQSSGKKRENEFDVFSGTGFSLQDEERNLVDEFDSSVSHSARSVSRNFEGFVLDQDKLSRQVRALASVHNLKRVDRECYRLIDFALSHHLKNVLEALVSAAKHRCGAWPDRQSFKRTIISDPGTEQREFERDARLLEERLQREKREQEERRKRKPALTEADLQAKEDAKRVLEETEKEILEGIVREEKEAKARAQREESERLDRAKEQEVEMEEAKQASSTVAASLGHAERSAQQNAETLLQKITDLQSQIDLEQAKLLKLQEKTWNKDMLVELKELESHASDGSLNKAQKEKLKDLRLRYEAYNVTEKRLATLNLEFSQLSASYDRLTGNTEVLPAAAMVASAIGQEPEEFRGEAVHLNLSDCYFCERLIGTRVFQRYALRLANREKERIEEQYRDLNDLL